MPLTETFEPYKKTLGSLLASTSPALRVPDYQRDYSWDKEQISEFWEDILSFGGGLNAKPSGEYFLGATVLVDNGTFHLVLDGQQRLATATILLAAIRDAVAQYKADAAQQIQDQFIVFQDAITGERIPRLELNIFDRGYFRDLIQAFPMQSAPAGGKKSHFLISKAFDFFKAKMSEAWNARGGGKDAFEWAGRLAVLLRNHIVLITVVSKDEKSAGSIFTALNDRGIGLSTVDLVRSHILQRAHESQREELLDCWDRAFEAVGSELGSEALMRVSWVSQHGDIKSRSLYRVISDSLNENEADGALAYSQRLRDDALLYRKIRDGDTDDPDLEQCWLALRTLKFNAGFPLLIAGAHQFSLDEQRQLAQALITLVVRHNIICSLDRANLESLSYSCAKQVSAGSTLPDVVSKLREQSPNNARFEESFRTLGFGVSDHGIARYLLKILDSELATTAEIDVAGADRVHVEHIYPQTPIAGTAWDQHAHWVKRFGNLTLLDRRLNVQIKNGVFAVKKEQAYKDSRLAITQALLQYDDWSPAMVEHRQAALCVTSKDIWPEHLVDV